MKRRISKKITKKSSKSRKVRRNPDLSDDDIAEIILTTSIITIQSIKRNKDQIELYSNNLIEKLNKKGFDGRKLYLELIKNLLGRVLYMS